MAIWSDGGVGIDGQCKAKVLKCRGTGVVTVEKEGSPITMPIPITITQCWQLKTPLESPFQPPEPPTSPLLSLQSYPANALDCTVQREWPWKDLCSWPREARKINININGRFGFNERIVALSLVQAILKFIKGTLNINFPHWFISQQL